MSDVLSVEEIREALHDRKLAMIARATGINYVTLHGLYSGKVTRPSYKTLTAISNYLQGKK